MNNKIMSEPTILANGVGGTKKAIGICNGLLLHQLLSLTSFVILKPVEDILSLDVTISPEPRGNLLYLLSAGSPYSLLVKVLQHVYLLLCRTPS